MLIIYSEVQKSAWSEYK